VELIAVLSVLVLCLVALNALAWPRVPVSGAGSQATVSILIPARNEEANIVACLAGASAQGETVQEILVYDDHSEDETAALVQRLASRDPRIRLLAPEPLPEGWKGKPLACSRLAAAARSDWLLFVDADTVLAEGVAPHLIRTAEASQATLVSFWPGLVLEGLVQQWLMPLLNMTVFTLFPAPVAFRRNLPSLGLAHGACMLFHAPTYRRLGGHSLVANELFEDTMLAREWRAHGERSLCYDGQDAVKVRMYRTFGELWNGFRKNFYPAFRTRSGFWLFMLYHFTVFFLPFCAATGCIAAGRPCAAAWIACGSVVAMRLVQAARFRYPAWSALMHPAAEAVLLSLGIASWWSIRSGSGVTWKGRRYGVR
jgi:glycosyltransferase involved in cell wall biosynthesis